jgi:hydrogenase nickel incorporation protein HypA/HybF
LPHSVSLRNEAGEFVHELSVTESLLNLAVHHAQQAGAVRVTDLYLVIGQLSSLVDDSVQFYWDMISAGTLCEKARLHFERIPAKFQCLDCSEEYQLPGELIACPRCNSARLKVIAGDEFRLDHLEADMAEDLAKATS